MDADLERAILENARIRCTPDFKEGLASFLEKRKPVWRGDRAVSNRISAIQEIAGHGMIEYHDATVRVRYAETDQMGVVYHANYLIWFEVGRVELMRALGFEYKRMEIEDDCHIVVADAHCRYHHSARLRRSSAHPDAHRGITKPHREVFLRSDSRRGRKSAGERRNDARDLRKQRPAENCCRKNTRACSTPSSRHNPDRSTA